MHRPIAEQQKVRVQKPAILIKQSSDGWRTAFFFTIQQEFQVDGKVDTVCSECIESVNKRNNRHFVIAC